MSTREERLAAVARARRAAQAAAQDRHDRALRHVPALLHPVLKLHGPTFSDWSPWVECHGCDPGAYAESSADWPCATWDLIVEAHGGETVTGQVVVVDPLAVEGPGQ